VRGATHRWAQSSAGARPPSGLQQAATRRPQARGTATGGATASGICLALTECILARDEQGAEAKNVRGIWTPGQTPAPWRWTRGPPETPYLAVPAQHVVQQASMTPLGPCIKQRPCGMNERNRSHTVADLALLYVGSAMKRGRVEGAKLRTKRRDCAVPARTACS
jgi:hypothetical protein